MTNTIRLSVSVPKKVYKEIEARRGDVSRSRFITRTLERIFFDEVDPNQLKLEA